MQIQLILTADALPGRFDSTMLDDQARMELLVADLTEVQGYLRDADGNFLSFVEWNNVAIDEDSGLIKCIGFQHEGAGSIHLEYMPESVETLTIMETTISGTIETSNLPEGMKYIQICGPNGRRSDRKFGFHGTLDCTSLPKHLETCEISCTMLSGCVDLTKLPEGLCELTLRDNFFDGTIELEDLPKGLTLLNLGDSDFSGELCFSNLPQSLHTLTLCRCAFSGAIVLEKLPPVIAVIHLQGNKFSRLQIADACPESLVIINVECNEISGTAIVHSSVPMNMHSLGRGIKDIVDENGQEVRFSRDEKGEILSILSS